MSRSIASFLPEICRYLEKCGERDFGRGAWIMTDNLQHFEGQYAARQSHYFDVQTRRFVFVPDEHDDETPRRWRRGLLRRGIFLLTVFCLGWTIYSDPSRVGRWWSTVRGMAQPIIERALDQADAAARAPGSIVPTSNDDATIATTTPAFRFTTPYSD